MNASCETRWIERAQPGGRAGPVPPAVLSRLRGLRGWRAGAAGCLLGVAAACSLPPLTLVPVLLATVPGLLALIDGAASPARAAWRGLAFGMGLHLVGLYWITEAILVRASEFWWAVPVAVPALASVLSLFIALACAAARLAAPGWRRAAVLAGAWVLGDLARQFVMTGFPWNPLGSAWEMPGAAGILFMQPAAWVGVHGLTLFTLLVAAAPTLAWRGRLAAAILLGGWALLGVSRLHVAAEAAPGLRAVLVQGNVPEAEHLGNFDDRAWARDTFARHLDLTRAGVRQALTDGPGPVLVVWPETASPYALAAEPEARRAVAEAAAPAVASLIGAPRIDATGAHNSLIAIGADGAVAGTYDKSHLVPYGEYFPSYLPIRLGEQGWVAGPGLRTLHLRRQAGASSAGRTMLPAIGPLICYEAIFPGQVVQPGDRPAFLVNITNDAWFGNSTGPRQHLAAARMRSVEEGLPMLRAANTGISAMIDAHGRILAQLALEQTGTLVAAIPGRLPPTPASRLGLAVPLLLALGCCAAGFTLARGAAFGTTSSVSKKVGMG